MRTRSGVDALVPALNENSRHALIALAEHEDLAHTFLPLNLRPLSVLLPRRLAGHLEARSLPSVVEDSSTTTPVEMKRLLIRTAASTLPPPIARLLPRNDFAAVTREVQRKALTFWSRMGPPAAVLAPEDCAADVFDEASRLAIPRIYELPIAHWRSAIPAFDAARQRHPDWVPTLAGRYTQPTFQADKEREAQMATFIIAASSYTAQSIARIPGVTAPVVTIPYGFPEPAPRQRLESTRRPGPLRLLFVGSLTQRKGLADLLEARRHVRTPTTLTLIGRPLTRSGSVPALDRALSHVHWIPHLNRQQLTQAYDAHDVLVLPSLHEGFGLVLTEAMARGMAVIATTHTAAPDLFDNGQAGFIIEPGNVDDLVQAIERASDLQRLNEMSERAWIIASAYGWDRYRSTYAAFVRQVYRGQTEDG